MASIQDRFQSLGLSRFKTLIQAASTPHSPVKANNSGHRNTEDPDYDPEVDMGSVGDENVTITSPSKKLYKRIVHRPAQRPPNTKKMPPGGTRPSKRVKATDPRTGVTTRSTKNLASAQPNEDRSTIQQAADDQVQNQGQASIVEPRSPVRDWSYEGESFDADEGGEPVAPNENNQSDNADTPIPTCRGKRPQTMGKSPDKMTRAMGRRMPIQFTEGVRRPQNSEQAAKLASEEGIHIRQSMPILTHWKEYKNNTSHLDNFMGKLSTRLAMDTTAKPTNDARTDLFKGAIRQARHRLKKRFFDCVPANEISATSSVPQLSDDEWRKLVKKWKSLKRTRTIVPKSSIKLQDLVAI